MSNVLDSTHAERDLTRYKKANESLWPRGYRICKKKNKMKAIHKGGRKVECKVLALAVGYKRIIKSGRKSWLK